MRAFEYKYQKLGYKYIAGVDEAGRGPLCGPVVSGAVIFPLDYFLEEINDSKKLSEKKRESLFDIIIKDAIAYGIGIVSAEDIDKYNIREASFIAMRLAIDNLKIKPDCVLADGFEIPKLNIKQESIIKGDSKSISIAAASIIAKVTRDRMMIEYDKQYPQYNFAKHKGYGTKVHIEAIEKYGPCFIHRKTFQPIAKISNR